METIGKRPHVFAQSPQIHLKQCRLKGLICLATTQPPQPTRNSGNGSSLGYLGTPKILKKWVINMSTFYQNDPPQKKPMSSHPKWQLMATYPTVSWSSSSPCSTLDLPGTEEATLSWSVQSRPQWMQLSFWNEIAILGVSCRVTVIGKSYWKNHVVLSHVYSIFM